MAEFKSLVGYRSVGNSACFKSYKIVLSFNGLGQLPSKQFIEVRILLELHDLKLKWYKLSPVKRRTVGSNPIGGTYIKMYYNNRMMLCDYNRMVSYRELAQLVEWVHYKH